MVRTIQQRRYTFYMPPDVDEAFCRLIKEKYAKGTRVITPLLNTAVQQYLEREGYPIGGSDDVSQPGNEGS